MLFHKLVLIYVINKFLLGNCIPGYISDSFVYEKRAGYETNHMKNYIIAPDEYNQWPELTKENEMEVCQKYVSTLFSDKPRSVPTAWTKNVILRYHEMERIGTKVDFVPFIKALHCEIFPLLDRRKYMYFMKSPTPNCLYLGCHSGHCHSILHIIEEVCLGGNYDAWEVCRYNRYYKRKCIVRKNYLEKYSSENHYLKEEYESNHFKDYKLNKIRYEEWPLMNENDRGKYCKSLLEQLFPNNKYSNFIGECVSIPLKYKQIRFQKNESSLPLKLGGLECRLPHKIQKNCYRFIRAQKADCVYLVKKTNSRSISYNIAKQICVLQILHGQREDPKLLNFDLNLPAEEHLLDSVEEECKSEDEVGSPFDETEDMNK